MLNEHVSGYEQRISCRQSINQLPLFPSLCFRNKHRKANRATLLAEPFPGSVAQGMLFGATSDWSCLLCYLKAAIPPPAGM